MAMVLFYRHEDGRMIELKDDGSRVETWLVYPHRELIGKAKSVDEAKEELDDGFELDESVFCPPCPKCQVPSPMSLENGMYVCPDCGASF